MRNEPKIDHLEKVRKQLQTHIDKNYITVEQFCWDTGLNKATVSNFLNNKKDFQISTLEKIAKAMGKSLSVRFDS